MEKDYYDILGVPKDASEEDIKRAYHILAHQFHPDRPDGSERRFKAVNEAYRILSDSKSRAKYDREFANDQSSHSEEMEHPQDEGKGTSTPWLIALIVIIVVGGIALIAFLNTSSNTPQPTPNQAASSASSTGGQSYYMQNGSFSMAFTTQPKFSTIPQELEKGYNVTDYDYNDTESNYVLSADYVHSAFPDSTLTPDENLENELTFTGNLNGLGVVPGSVEFMAFKGSPAIEYTSCNDTTKACFAGRDILKGDDLYETGYSYYLGQEDKQLEDTFFNSLTFGAPTNTNKPKAPSSPSQPTNQQPQSTAPTSGSLTTALINQIEPSIVEINCYSANGNVEVSGSGTSNLNDGVLHVTTNYHIYNEATGGGEPPTCYAVYPGPPDFSYNAEYGDYQLTLIYHAYDTDTYEDEAEFTIGSLYPSATPLTPLPSINSLPITGMGAAGCPDATVGDSVTVFGYPASGNALGISETVTQGTIAGILPGPIYKFDGAIDHGNSGGLAVLDKDSCVLGIPTLGDSGLTAGIGYIQSFVLAAQPVTQTNAQVCENDYGPYSVWGGQTNSSGGPTCDCENGYEWNSNQTACVAQPNGYQVCGNEFSNETWDGTYGSNGQFNCVCDDGYTWNGSQCVNAQ